MMKDDSIISHERLIDCLSMKRLENQFCLIYFSRNHSILMRKCVAEQILGNWLETFSTYLESYSLDVEVIMEVELHELKHFCIIPFEGSKEKQSIELIECWTLMMNLVIFGKTMTSNGTTVFGNILLCYVNLSKTTVWSTDWNRGWHFIAVEKEHSK